MESLTQALTGQDAVVSTVGTDGLLGQTLLIDAAIRAGVKRFLPSEFGSDLDNPKAAVLPVFGYKVTVLKHLRAAIEAQSGEGMTYTNIRTSIFLDWGMNTGFFFDLQDDKATVYDGGDQLFSTTTLKTVGQAVVNVLSLYEETKNRSLYIHDIAISQNSILQLGKEVFPGRTWKGTVVQTSDIRAKCDAALAKGDYSMGTMLPYLYSSIWAEGYGGYYANPDNELLGLTFMDGKGVKAIIRTALGLPAL